MKLSEMDTATLCKAMCDLAGPIDRIGSDEALSDAFRYIDGMKGKSNVLQATSAFIGKIIPVLLERHKADTMVILSVLLGKPVKEIEMQPAMKTIKEVRGVIDVEFLDFFSQSV